MSSSGASAPGTSSSSGAASSSSALPRIVAPSGLAVVPDGALAEWDTATWTPLPAVAGAPQPPVVDLSAYVAVQWNTDALCLAVMVTDDVHRNVESADSTYLWRGDSIQFAFDVDHDGDDAAYFTEDRELGCAVLSPDSQLRTYRWAPTPAGATGSGTCSVQNADNTWYYEVCYTAAELGQPAFTAGTVFGFCAMVNDDDGAGRDQWLELTPGMGTGKQPSLFRALELAP
ncbi:MAG: hypothetical protein HY904_09870 [Deltaproteobacteria bacterium]|nr:hypothetical protein [Deltaproteobacteria bacterium]